MTTHSISYVISNPSGIPVGSTFKMNLESMKWLLTGFIFPTWPQDTIPSHQDCCQSCFHTAPDNPTQQQPEWFHQSKTVAPLCSKSSNGSCLPQSKSQSPYHGLMAHKALDKMHTPSCFSPVIISFEFFSHCSPHHSLSSSHMGLFADPWTQQACFNPKAFAYAIHFAKEALSPDGIIAQLIFFPLQLYWDIIVIQHCVKFKVYSVMIWLSYIKKWLSQ